MAKRLLLLIVLIITLSLNSLAQIKGRVLDSDSLPLPAVNVSYGSKGPMTRTDVDGEFEIRLVEDGTLTFTSVGYKPKQVRISASTNEVLIVMEAEYYEMSELVVGKKQKSRYSRKNNPAVELMKRVVEANKVDDLEGHDYYSYDTYQKLTLSLNDITDGQLEKGILSKKWMRDYMEVNAKTGKRTMPISINEKVTRHIYHRDPKEEKEIVMGERSDGLNEIFQTGDVLNELMKDVFTDVDIRGNYVRLLQYRFVSPIGRSAVSFYQFFILDTLDVDGDRCYELQFMPNNSQDFGFRGEIYIMADSSLRVRKCNLSIPVRSGVNFVTSMRVEVAYKPLPTGEWVQTQDDMWVEMSVVKNIGKMLATRTTSQLNHSFEPIESRLFGGKSPTRRLVDASMKSDAFWTGYRPEALTKTESGLGKFLTRLTKTSHFGALIFVAKAFVENYVETFHTPKVNAQGDSVRSKSMFDIGPITSMLSFNYVDKVRIGIGGRTTAGLSPHWFLEGFYAYGFRSHKHYYRAALTYSINAKDYVPFEFPQRTFTFESTYDLMALSDKYLKHSSHNLFMSIKWQNPHDMFFYNRQRFSYVYETDWGLSMNFSTKAERIEPAGDLQFVKLSDGELLSGIRTTEFSGSLHYSPGLTFITTKQRRMPVNLDSPQFTVSHSTAVTGLLGGKYHSNISEFHFYKRTWLGSWGYINLHIDAMAQWNKVPFPLLLVPPANTTYIGDETTFGLMRNMEFLSDRQAFLSIMWDMNGKILNRIPLIHKLKWREYIAFKGVIGYLSDKNNPTLADNAGDPILLQFPDGTNALRTDHPYMEAEIGLHNIFKFLTVGLVYRINYHHLPNTKRFGVRFSYIVSF